MASDRNPDDAERPRPRYGELAPEGWTWQPPQQGPGATPVPPPPPVAPPGQVPAQQLPSGPTPGAPWTNPAAARTTPRSPSWDLTVTIILIVVGLFGTLLAIAILTAVPQAVQVLYTQEGLGTYSPAPTVAGLITAGSITEGAVWLAATTVSILLLTRGRRAFYVPLIGGVVGFVVLFVFMSIVLTTDPTLFDFFSRP